jgi:peptidoglycan/xylan/chitin deacetylase (PgdA/CDA1 family)
MRRIRASVVGVACLVACGTVSARAQTPASVDACATRSDILGLSRVVEVDTAKGPMFGRTPKSPYDFLADHEVVLTFDDGPSPSHTQAVLDALAAHCTKATFFMVGRMAAADPAMVREVARRGHTVAAHTWSHARLQGLDFDKAKDEIELGFSAVARARGGPIAPFFRFPYLRTSKATIAYLKSRHIASFGIDVDSRDFKTRDGARVKANVLAQLAKRRKGILLFHDIQPSTAHALKDILDALKARGYKVVHLVPKTAVTTLADYDTLADREFSHRKIASTKRPLASRSVVWPQSGAKQKSTREVLPWAHDRKPVATKAKALRKSERVPWYDQWLQP